jgi:serine/threonine protein kinase
VPLTPGTSIGPYEIVGPLGSGGMGDVYRARDPRLGREVAIKALPDGFAADPERVTRLEREARLLASLSHPNIAMLFGIERVNGSPFLALELIEGESLAQRLERGPLPVDEALDIAAQVAVALEAAHDAGVIHRDLKPGNIMVRADGVAKVLDFGLARGPVESMVRADLSQSPTLVSPATIPGMILGTAAYMSPEQARGRVTDRRADTWAWGCVLYECLTGKRAFPGEDVSETLAAILKSDPDWSALPASTPPGVRALLERCLRKDPRERLRDAGDVHLLLAEARAPEAPRKPASNASQSFAFQIGITLIASVAGVAVTRMLDSRKPEAATVMLAAPAGVAFARSPTSIAVSPDGQQLVFVATDTTGAPRLWLRSVSRENSRPLSGSEDADYPFWSPDGRRVGFFAAGRLKTMDLGTGAVQSLAEAPLPRGGAWGRDRILYQPRSVGPLWSIPEDGGTPAVATAVDTAAGDYGHRFPQFLPGGRRFILSVLDSAGASTAIGEIGKPGVRKLFVSSSSTGAVWTSGWLIALRDGVVRAQRLDSRARRLKGPAIDLPGVRVISPDASGSPIVVASASGTLVQRYTGDLPQRLALVDRQGRTIRDVPAPPGVYRRGSISPDGRFAVFEYTAPGSSTFFDLWRTDLVRGTTQPLTFDGDNLGPAVSPDGSEVAFSHGESQDLWIMRIDDPGSMRRVAGISRSFNTPLGYTADGRGVLLRSQGTDTRQDLMFVSWRDSVRVTPVAATRFNEPVGAVSPDGRWLAYLSDESGQYECRVRQFPTGAGAVTVVSHGAWTDPNSSNRIGMPRWRRDGRELVYAAADGRTLMSVEVTPGATPSYGPPRLLFRIPNGATDLATTPDLDQFLLSITQEEEGRSVATLILNWPRLVEKRK